MGFVQECRHCVAYCLVSHHSKGKLLSQGQNNHTDVPTKTLQEKGFLRLVAALADMLALLPDRRGRFCSEYNCSSASQQSCILVRSRFAIMGVFVLLVAWQHLLQSLQGGLSPAYQSARCYVQVDTTFGKGVTRVIGTVLGACIGFGIVHNNVIFFSPYYSAALICACVFVSALLTTGIAQEVRHLFFAG